MPTLARLLRRLDVRAGEGRAVLLLLALSFSQGWALVFIDIAATALFLSALGTAALPGAYMAVAVVVPLSGMLLGWLGQRVAPERLTVGTLIALAALLAALWGATLLSSWALVGLLIWHRVLSALSTALFSGVSGSQLNLRQSKRLAGLINSGENVSRVIGYGLTPLLIGLFGIPALLVGALAGLGGAIAATLALGQRVAARPPGSISLARPARPAGLRAILSGRYTLHILALVALTTWGSTTLDLSFSQVVQQRFSDAVELAEFLAGLSLAISVARLVGRLLLSAPLIGRFGVRLGLLAQPSTLAVAALALAGGALASWDDELLWVAVAARFADILTSAILSRPMLHILLQPLPVAQRLTTLSLADGVVGPAAVGAVGLIGLAAQGAGPHVLALALLAICAAWMVVAGQVQRRYLLALRQNLVRRVGMSVDADLSDPATLSLVRRALASPHVGEALYAIELLGQRAPAMLAQEADALLAHPDPYVRQALLAQVSAGALPGSAPALAALVEHEADPPTRAAAIRALCVTAEAEAVAVVAPAVGDADPTICRSAIVGLVRHAGLAGILAAGRRLIELAESPKPAARALAAEIIGELASHDLQQLLLRLLADPDVVVRRAALLAAGQIGSPRLIAAQIDGLRDRATSMAAAASLERCGDTAAPALLQALHDPSQPERPRIAAVLGQISSPLAIAALRDMLRHPDGELRTAVLAALESGGYRAVGHDRRLTMEQIRSEAAQAAWLLAAIADIRGGNAGLLLDALDQELVRARVRILGLLALCSDAQSIAAARANLAQGVAERRSYAVEIIDVLLPISLKPLVLPLFDDLPEEERRRRMLARFPQPALGWAARLDELSGSPQPHISGWVRACALHCAALARHGPAASDAALIDAIERGAALRRIDLFAETPGQALAVLAERLSPLELEPGTTLFMQGDPGDALYLVVSGAVRIHVGPQTLGQIGPGGSFGEIALIDGSPRSASATAVEQTQLLRLAPHDLGELLHERPEVVRSLIRTLTRYLRASVATLAELRAGLR